MNEVVDHYYLRKPNLPERTQLSRFIGCHIKFGGDHYRDNPMSIWVMESQGNETFMPISNLGSNYDAWLISDLLQGHMRKATHNQYVNARVRAMKGDR